ncbi:hypothetical protein DOE73_30330 [Paenibacillus dendritiformis]|nr:hypothetical protein DOE73_30330 [Paenibacillus dendritiformis]
MTPYEKVFREFVLHLSPEQAAHESRIFYVGQVRRILRWTDLTDAKQLSEIRALDHAFRTIVTNE